MIFKKRPPNKFKVKLRVTAIKSHCKHWKSEDQMLKHPASELTRLNISNQNNHEELEQYGRRIYL